MRESIMTGKTVEEATHMFSRDNNHSSSFSL